MEDTEYDTFAKYRGGWGGKVSSLKWQIMMRNHEIIVSLEK